MECTDRIEIALLSPRLSPDELEHQIGDAKRKGFAGVHHAPAYVSKAKAFGLLVTAVIGYPLGMNKASVKAIEATVAVKDGAGEVAVVPHFPNLKSADLLKAELMEIARGCRAARRDVLISVIVDPVGLDAEMICRAVRESGGDSVQLKAADLEIIRAWKAHSSGLVLKVEANDVGAAQVMIAAGADRIILNSAVAESGKVL